MLNRLLVWVPLLLLFGFAFWRVSGRTRPEGHYHPRWIAMRRLELNHQITEGDLGYPNEWFAAARSLLQDRTADGQHLVTGARDRGESVTLEDLSPRPNLIPRSENGQIYFYVLKEDRAPAGGWSEGVAAIPCYENPSKKQRPTARPVCIHRPLTVVAVHRSTRAGEGSWLALDVPADLRCTFAEFATAEKRFLYQLNR